MLKKQWSAKILKVKIYQNWSVYLTEISPSICFQNTKFSVCLRFVFGPVRLPMEYIMNDVVGFNLKVMRIFTFPSLFIPPNRPKQTNHQIQRNKQNNCNKPYTTSKNSLVWSVLQSLSVGRRCLRFVFGVTQQHFPFCHKQQNNNNNNDSTKSQAVVIVFCQCQCCCCCGHMCLL